MNVRISALATVRVRVRVSRPWGGFPGGIQLIFPEFGEIYLLYKLTTESVQI